MLSRLSFPAPPEVDMASPYVAVRAFSVLHSKGKSTVQEEGCPDGLCWDEEIPTSDGFVLFEEKTLDGSGWMQDDVVASAGASEEVEHVSSTCW